MFDNTYAPWQATMLGTVPGMGKTAAALLFLELYARANDRQDIENILEFLQYHPATKDLSETKLRKYAKLPIICRADPGDDILCEEGGKIVGILMTHEQRDQLIVPRYPHLILVPVAVIPAWIETVKTFLKDWKLHVYYGTPVSAPCSKKLVVEKKKFPGLMATLNRDCHVPAVSGRFQPDHFEIT
jgi:SNF2 family DNA or RNA helicase